MLSIAGWTGLLGRRSVDCRLPALDYPLDSIQRIAVVGTLLRQERHVRSYVHWRSPELENWRPQALAGHRGELFAIGELRRKKFIRLSDLTFPLVVLSSLREGPLSARQHDQLWNLYGLPVFEQIRGLDESLLGWECDCRNGYHLALNPTGEVASASERIRAAGWHGAQSQVNCSCGVSCLKLTMEERMTALPLACGAD